MQTGDPQLIAIVRAAIAAAGPLPFARFMELALYHPRHGYYAGGRARLGREGDYFTNVSVGPLFGRLLARQFAAWQRALGGRRVAVVEQGAHDGRFARDLLGAWCGGPIGYTIVEPHPALAARQRHVLAPFTGPAAPAAPAGPAGRRGAAGVNAVADVRWVESWDDLAPFTGVVFANELLDAFPVRQVVRRAGEWRERCVGWRDDRFVWADGPVADLGAVPGAAPDGAVFETRPAVGPWLQAVADRLQSGYLLLVDYGPPPAAAGPHPGWRPSSIACYRRHRRGTDPLAWVGEQDLTADVDFAAVVAAATGRGFRLAASADQHHFLVPLAAAEFPDVARPDAARRTAMRQLTTLMHPELMGRGFRAITLVKGEAGNAAVG